MLESISTYYIVFDKKRDNQRFWWSSFVSFRFSHCYVLIGCGEESTALIEHTYGGTYFHVYNSPTKDKIIELSRLGVTAILSYTVNSTNLHKRVHRGPISCVSLVKSLLWIQDFPLAMTPFSLYKLLLSKGAEPILYYCPYAKRTI